MASLMESLIGTINDLCKEYEALLELSERKTKVIVNSDVDSLQKITDEEQELVSRIAVIDKQRATAMADIANVLNKDVSKMTLQTLVKALSARPGEQQLLAAAHDRLQTAVKSLKRVNEQNGELLKNALDMVGFELNLIQAVKSAPVSANYNRGAYSSGDLIGTVRGGFDAKQ